MKKVYLSILMIVFATSSTFSQNTTSKPKMASQKDVAAIISLAKSNFNATINSKRVVYAFQDDGTKITAAPILNTSANKDNWQNVAVVIIAPDKRKGDSQVLPFGTYILQYNGTTGRYIDNKEKTVIEGPISTSPVAKINLGWLHIYRSCVCWKNKNGEYICYCAPIPVSSSK